MKSLNEESTKRLSELRNMTDVMFNAAIHKDDTTAPISLDGTFSISELEYMYRNNLVLSHVVLDWIITYLDEEHYGSEYSQVDRVEVIDASGRSYSRSDITGKVRVSIQDGGKTLMIFAN
tara:strand:+ start:88 stop:447 length:360 start_codon:yes stop_codon:yes gene_type:complete